MSQSIPDTGNAAENRRWGFAWASLTVAFALHVIDESLTGFLPVYNSVILAARETYAFVPFPTFTFPVWLGSLLLSLLILFMMTPLVFAGRRPMRFLSYVFSVVMILNGLGHLAASLYWGVPAPGVYSSPLLLIAGIWLWIAVRRAVTPRIVRN